jgi:hypothetical protein
MKLSEDGPKYGPNHVAVVNFYCCADDQNSTNHDTQEDANNAGSTTPMLR